MLSQCIYQLYPICEKLSMLCLWCRCSWKVPEGPAVPCVWETDVNWSWRRIGLGELVRNIEVKSESQETNTRWDVSLSFCVCDPDFIVLSLWVVTKYLLHLWINKHHCWICFFNFCPILSPYYYCCPVIYCVYYWGVSYQFCFILMWVKTGVAIKSLDLWICNSKQAREWWREAAARSSSNSRPGPSLIRGPDVSLSGDSVESLCELALEKALSLGSVSAMSDRASLSSSSGWVKIQSSARSRLLFWKSIFISATLTGVINQAVRKITPNAPRRRTSLFTGRSLCCTGWAVMCWYLRHRLWLKWSLKNKLKRTGILICSLPLS